MIAESKPLIDWSDPPVELLGFALSFLASGAIGFGLVVLGRRVTSAFGSGESGLVLRTARHRAAIFGLVGACGMLAMFINNLPALAARQHLSISRLLTTNAVSALQFAAAIVAVAGFLLAAGRLRFGWQVAAVGVIGKPLASVATGAWRRTVNPIHMLAGGFWIGTLFILLVAGLATVRASRLESARRGVLAAEMVHSFSPLALTAASILAFTGVVTAWLHLKHFSALWTTPYGYTLIVKLVLVLVVLGLGAWNWRRQRPLLGTELATEALWKSAMGELIAAGAVLIATSILVSLPSPR
ncbi:MAG: CopD family protein [Acidobacteriota bacterium]